MWKAYGFIVERYDENGHLRSKEIINKELEAALKDNWENFRKYQERRYKIFKKMPTWPEVYLKLIKNNFI